MRKLREAAVVAGVAALVGASPALATPRPTDSGDGVFGIPNYSVAEQQPYCLARVCVHWVATTDDAPPDLRDTDADGVPDTVEHTAEALASAYGRETGTPAAGLAWREPPSDGTLGGDDRTDLYLQNLRGVASGVAPRDEGQRSPTVHGFIVLDRAYAGAGVSGSVLRDVIAHELNHLEQYAYDGYAESWYAEATAEWMMDQVEPGFRNVANSSGFWAADTAEPLVSRRTGDFPPPKSYGSSVWNLWLAEHYGPGSVRAAWEAAVDQPYYSFTPTSFDAVLAPHDRSFAGEFVRFAAASAEWRMPGAGFGPSGDFPDVERVGNLSAGGTPATVTLDHTTFALLDVPARRGGAIRLRVHAPVGLRSGIALVGRSGTEVTTAMRYLPDGGPSEVTLQNPGAFERITAVLVNADATRTSTSKDASGQWTFARDGESFTATLDGIPGDPVHPAIGPGTVTEQPPGAVALPPPLRLGHLRRVLWSSLLRGRALRLPAKVVRTCTARVQLLLDPVVVHKLGLTRPVVGARTVHLKRGRDRIVVRIAARVRRRLSRARIKAEIRIRLLATEASGRRALFRRVLRPR